MTLQILRRLGAIALLAVGAVHLQRYLGGNYRVIPTIGPLFLLNAIGAGVVAIGLLIPIERLLRGQRAELATGLLAAAGVAIALGSLVALYISETGMLFGFSEFGYGSPIAIAIVTEAVTVVLLAPVAAVTLRRAAAERGGPRSTRALSAR